MLLNNFIFVCKSCNILSSLTIFIRIVYNTTLYYLILRLILVSRNSNFYLSLYSSNLFAFDFLIVVITIEVFFTNFNIVYTIDFSIVLLLLFCVFIELSLVYFSTIRYLLFIPAFEIV